jgi:hypothetical protein
MTPATALERILGMRSSGRGIHLREGHKLRGRRMPDLDLVTANGPLRERSDLLGKS